MGWIHGLLLGSDPEADMARAAEAERQLAALNESRRAERGEDWFEQTQRNLDADNTEITGLDDVHESFEEGFQDGVQNIRGAVGSAVSLPFRLVPWQLWVVGGVALFLYMGGGVLLKGILKTKR